MPHIIFLVFFRTSSETFTTFTAAKALCGETWKDIYFPIPIATGVFNRFFNSIYIGTSKNSDGCIVILVNLVATPKCVYHSEVQSIMHAFSQCSNMINVMETTGIVDQKTKYNALSDVKEVFGVDVQNPNINAIIEEQCKKEEVIYRKRQGIRPPYIIHVKLIIFLL